MMDPRHRADRWRAFYEEEGGIRDALELLRRAYFERAAELPVKDTAGLQKLSIASKLVEELDRHVVNIIASGDIAGQQKQHLARIEKVGRFW